MSELITNLEKSQFGLMIREDNREVRVFSSKFEKKLGDVFNIEGTKFKVCYLSETENDASQFMTDNKKALINWYDYNTKNGLVYSIV